MKVKIKPILRTDLNTNREEKRIDLQILCQGKYTKLSTQYHARPAEWNSKAGRIKSTNAYAITANRYIKDKVAEVENFVLERTFHGDAYNITIVEIKALLNGTINILQPKKKNDKATIEEIFDLYLDFLRAIDKRQNTIRNYITHKRIICGFAKKHYGQLVTIRNLNLGFVRELRKYLQNGRKNMNGTIAKRLVGLRAVIRYAIHEGYEIDNPFNRYNNLIPMGDCKTTFLDADEYSRFRKLKLPMGAKRSMRLSHKMFGFCCETGLRYSDMQDLKWEHLLVNDSGKYEALEKTQVKTGNFVHVPLSNQAVAIIMLNSRNNNGEYVFDRIEGQTINNNLKILAQMADIDKTLSFHVSRHTFATNLANNGANEFEIAQLLGDKKLDMARIYVNSDAKGLKNTMAKVWNSMSKNSHKLERTL